MAHALSSRLQAVVDALPLRRGLRVLEIGCGSGAVAREVASRVGGAEAGGYVMGIDRSQTAVTAAIRAGRALRSDRCLSFRRVAVEGFVLEASEAPFDLAFAIRVGALDGLHPLLEARALTRLRAALTPAGRLFVDGGDPLRELRLRN